MREGDGEVVVQEVGADAERVRSRLMREVVDDFVEVVEAARGRSGERAEGGDAGDADGGADGIVGQRREIAVA